MRDSPARFVSSSRSPVAPRRMQSVCPAVSVTSRLRADQEVLLVDHCCKTTPSRITAANCVAITPPRDCSNATRSAHPRVAVRPVHGTASNVANYGNS